MGENHSQGPHGDTGLKEVMEVGLQESERSLGLEGIIKWESARFWFHFTVQISDFKFFSPKQNLS